MISFLLILLMSGSGDNLEFLVTRKVGAFADVYQIEEEKKEGEYNVLYKIGNVVAHTYRVTNEIECDEFILYEHTYRQKMWCNSTDKKIKEKEIMDLDEGIKIIITHWLDYKSRKYRVRKRFFGDMVPGILK